MRDVEHVLDVVNCRHWIAQIAGRSSVGFYVGLALKGRNEREGKNIVAKVREVFVIRTFRNSVSVFVSKYVLPALDCEYFSHCNSVEIGR